MGDYPLAVIVMFNSLFYYTGLFFQRFPHVLLFGIVRFMYCSFKILNGFRNTLACGNWILFPMSCYRGGCKISIYTKLYFLFYFIVLMVMSIDMTTTLGLCTALTTIAAACVFVKQRQRDGTETLVIYITTFASLLSVSLGLLEVLNFNEKPFLSLACKAVQIKFNNI